MTTHCFHSSDEKVSVFMKKNRPSLNKIHKETVINDCPVTICDVRCSIKIDLSNTSIFDDKQDPPPTQALVTKKILQKYSRVTILIKYVDIR